MDPDVFIKNTTEDMKMGKDRTLEAAINKF